MSPSFQSKLFVAALASAAIGLAVAGTLFATLARQQGGDVRNLAVVVGVRLWM